MSDERPPVPTWGTVGKCIFVAGVLANAVSRIIDDDADGAGWAFRNVVASIAVGGLALWAVASIMWLVRSRQRA
jgi:hypothetical protein